MFDKALNTPLRYAPVSSMVFYSHHSNFIQQVFCSSEFQKKNITFQKYSIALKLINKFPPSSSNVFHGFAGFSKCWAIIWTLGLISIWLRRWLINPSKLDKFFSTWSFYFFLRRRHQKRTIMKTKRRLR